MDGRNRYSKLTLEVRRVDDEIRFGISHSSSENPETATVPVGARDTLIEEIANQVQSRIQAVNLAGHVEKGAKSLEELGRELFQVAFPESIAEAIRECNSEFLILDLDIELIGIPWELAHDGSDFLCCRFSVGRRVREWEPRARLARPSPTEKGRVLLFSNPAEDLPAASREAEALSNLLEGESGLEVAWLNEGLDRGSLRAWLPRFDLLHYCGHFETFEFDASSGSRDTGVGPGWKLTDGRFTAEDVSELAKQGQSLPLLVFNNACRSSDVNKTERARGEGLLAASFLSGGSQHYIGANSKIMDRCGLEFAEAFYQRVSNKGAIGTAIRLARLHIRSSCSPSGLTWAQYVLYGDPSKSLFGETALSPEVHSLFFAQPSASRYDCGSLLQELLVAFPEAESCKRQEGVACISFSRPSEAVRFSLLLHEHVRRNTHLPAIRVAISSGELLVERQENSEKLLGIAGFPVQVGTALLQIAEPDQTLTTRPVFDSARSMIRGDEIPGIRNVSWLDHGTYRFKDIEDPIGVREVGEEEFAPLGAPPDSALAHRAISPDDEPVLGWRPALEQEIPSCPRWVLTEKVGEGGFGEVWRARHEHSHRTSVFKFCFRADRVRSLKREATLFRILKERLGPHPNIVQINEVYFEEPPYFIAMEDVPGLNLGQWYEKFGADEKVVESMRLEIVAKVADALQAAHDAGVIHRDVKPSNVLVVGTPESSDGIDVKLTDFGIGQVQSQQMLADVTALGFTETYSRTEMTTGSGSRLYMAPELLVGKESSVRSDVYSLGVVLYQVLLGNCDQPLTSDWEKDFEDPVLLEDLRGCLAGDASLRFSSAGEVAARLRSVETRRAERRKANEQARTDSRRKRFLVGASAVTVVATLVATALGYGLRQAWTEREKVERSLYHAQIGEARRAVDDDDPALARSVLYDCPERFRGWEWGRLVYRSNLDHRALWGHEADLTAMDLSRNNDLLATGDESGRVLVWDFESGEISWDLPTGPLRVEAVSIDAESQKLAVLNTESLRVWDLETRSLLRAFQPEKGRRFSGGVHFAPVHDLVAVADREGTLFLYDLAADSTRQFQTNHTDVINDFVFTPDGTKVVTASDDFHSHLLDLTKGETIGRLKPGDQRVADVCLDTTGKRVYFAYGNHVREGNLSPFEFTQRTNQFAPNIEELAFGPMGRHYAVYSSSHQIAVADLEMMASDYRRGGGRAGHGAVSFTRDGLYLVSLEEDRSIRQRPIREGDEIDIELVGSSGNPLGLTFSPEGESLATFGAGTEICLWDTRTGEIRRKVTASDSRSVNCVKYRPDGKIAVAGTASGSVFLWSPETGEILHDRAGHSGGVTAVDFVPNSDRLATSGVDGNIRLWDPETMDEGLVIETGADRVNDISCSPDGKTLLSAGSDGTAAEWASGTGELIRRYSGHSREVRAVTYYPDGSRLVTGGDDNVVLIWDRETGERVGSLKASVRSAYELIVTPDGRRLFTTDRLWDLESFLPILNLHENGPKALSEDGLFLAAGTNIDNLRIAPAFPFRAAEISPRPTLPLVERIETYKRPYWRERPHTATGRISPISLDLKKKYGIVGQWNFTTGDFDGETSTDMEAIGDSNHTTTASLTKIGLPAEFGIPSIGGQPSEIMNFPSFQSDRHYRIYAKIPEGDHGSGPIEYTLLLDIYYPSQSTSRTRSIFNANCKNEDAPDFVVSATGGLGFDDLLHGQIEMDEWVRIVCAVDLSGVPTMNIYVDGAHIGTQSLPEGIGGRWSLRRGLYGYCLGLFPTRGGEGAEAYVNSVQFRNYAMTAEEVAALGGPSAAGIPTGISPPSRTE